MEKSITEQRYQVILTYDIDSDDRNLYRKIHDPLVKEGAKFLFVTRSTFLYEGSLTATEINIYAQRIRTLFLTISEKLKGNTTIIKLVVSKENTWEQLEVVPTTKRINFVDA